jgi:hypothetical protein
MCPSVVGGIEVPFEAGHEIQDNAVDVENHALQRMTEELHREPLPQHGVWRRIIPDPRAGSQGRGC